MNNLFKLLLLLGLSGSLLGMESEMEVSSRSLKRKRSEDSSRKECSKKNRPDIDFNNKVLREQINVQNSKGQTTFNAYIDRENYEGAEYLLDTFKENLDISTPDNNGVTPLQNAIVHRRIELAQRIIDLFRTKRQYGHINTTNKANEQTIMLAVEHTPELIPSVLRSKMKEEDAKKFFKILIEKGKIEEACLVAFKGAIPEEDFSISDNDLESIINKTFAYGPLREGTLLMYALRYGAPDRYIKRLIERGARINIGSADRRSVIDFGIPKHQSMIPCLKEYIKVGFSNLSNVYPCSLLSYSIRHKYSSVARILILNGEKLGTKDSSGFTGWSQAIKCNPKILKGLRLVSSYFEEPINFDEIDENGNTPLQNSVLLNPQAIKICMGEGSDIDFQDVYGNTALITAACMNFKAIPVLLDYNPNVNIHNDRGNTALIEALYMNLHNQDEYAYYQVIKSLLEAGADVLIENNEGLNALDYANDDDIKKLLESYISDSDSYSEQTDSDDEEKEKEYEDHGEPLTHYQNFSSIENIIYSERCMEPFSKPPSIKDLYHTYALAADYFIFKYGLDREQKHRRCKFKSEQGYHMAGEIVHHGYSEEVVFSCTKDRRGICYHRGYKLKENAKYFYKFEKNREKYNIDAYNHKKIEGEIIHFTCNGNPVDSFCCENESYIKILDDRNDVLLVLFKPDPE